MKERLVGGVGNKRKLGGGVWNERRLVGGVRNERRLGGGVWNERRLVGGVGNKRKLGGGVWNERRLEGVRNERRLGGGVWKWKKACRRSQKWKKAWRSQKWKAWSLKGSLEESEIKRGLEVESEIEKSLEELKEEWKKCGNVVIVKFVVFIEFCKIYESNLCDILFRRGSSCENWNIGRSVSGPSVSSTSTTPAISSAESTEANSASWPVQKLLNSCWMHWWVVYIASKVENFRLETSCGQELHYIIVLSLQFKVSV